jgi:hypothetical protein
MSYAHFNLSCNIASKLHLMKAGANEAQMDTDAYELTSFSGITVRQSMVQGGSTTSTQLVCANRRPIWRVLLRAVSVSANHGHSHKTSCICTELS